MNWTIQKIFTIEHCVKNYERSFHFAAYFRTIKAESKVLGSIDEKSSVMQEQREEGFG